MDKTSFTITITTHGKCPRTATISMPSIQSAGLRKFAQDEVGMELESLARWENSQSMIEELTKR